MQSNKKTIVIIGGGYAGIQTAKKLYKKFKSNKLIEIILIDKNPYHTLMTELHEVAGGRVEPESVMIYFTKIFGGTNVRVITDQVKTVDFTNHTVKTSSSTYQYDYLVLGTGAEPIFFGLPGIKEYSFTLWSMDDAIKIKQHIERMFLKASREADSIKRKELLTFIVGGGGLTGIEIAGELFEWKKSLCRQYQIKRDEVQIIVIEACSKIMSNMPEKLQQKALKFLQKKKVEVLLNTPIKEFKKDEVIFQNNQNIKAATLIWTCGVEGGSFAANLALTKGKCVYWDCQTSRENSVCTKIECDYTKEVFLDNIHARIKVNEYLQSVDYPEVYLSGDIIWFLQNGKPVPQIVETALQSGETVAHNIIADLNKHNKKIFKPKYHGIMVSIGSKYAVADLMNIPLTGFMAMIMKHLVNLHYLFDIAGINALWEYIKHHFLDVHDKRSVILSGHAAKKVRIYWIILLRLFLGIMWLTEGTTKVIGGWLNPANIYIISADKLISSDANTHSTENPEQESTVDTSTSATPEEEAPGQTDAVTSSSTETGSASNNQGLKPLLAKPLGLYTWFESAFIVKFPFFFQAIVVICEILIGLALIGGLFTFFASIGSIGLAIMFTVSAMSTKEILWYFFASIAVLGGGGKGFSLDYWVMPWLKRFWNKTILAKKTYTFIDEE